MEQPIHPHGWPPSYFLLEDRGPEVGPVNMNDNTAELRERLEYHPETDTYRVTYSNETDPPSAVVVEAITTITDCDIKDLVPLYEVVDPDALDALFLPMYTGSRRSDGKVWFIYQGYEVEVRSYGVIEIQKHEEDEPSGLTT